MKSPLRAAAVVVLCLSLALAGGVRAELAGLWLFDTDAPPASGTTSTVLDSSGKAYDGTLTAAAGTPDQRYSTDVPPELAGGKSLDLTGGDHFVKITGTGATVGLDMKNKFTVGFWFKGWPNYSGAAPGLPFISKGGNTGGAITTAQGWQIRRNAATNNFWFTTRGAGDDFDAGDTSGEKAASRWTHCTVTFDGTFKSVYLNGVHMKSVKLAAAASVTNSTDPVAFGAQVVDGVASSFARVKLDNVCMFTHVLTAAEIQHLAAGADPRNGLDTKARAWGAGEPWGTPGNWGVREWRLNGSAGAGGTLANLGDVRYALKYPSGGVLPPGAQAVTTSQRADGQRGWIDWADAENRGTNHQSANDAAFLTNTTADDNHFFTTSTGCLRIPAGASADNKWTFYWATDDGAELVIYNAVFDATQTNGNQAPGSGEFAMMGLGGTAFAPVTLPPGDYNVRFTHMERTGGASAELWAAPGTYNFFAPGLFELVGDVAGGGLEMVNQTPLAEFTTSTSVITTAAPVPVVLSWDTRFASSVVIDGGVGPVTPGKNSTTLAVAPSVTTTYTLTATHAGTSVTRTLTIYVDEPPRIQAFTAADTTILPGGSTTLNWTVQGATTLSIDQGVGSVTSVTNTTTGAGTKAVTVSQPAVTYTLTATNTFGTRTAQVTVTTGLPPVINSFTVADPVILTGAAADMSWVTTGANTASISPTVGAVPVIGRVCDEPLGTTTYTLSATNNYGTSTATVTAAFVQPLGVDAAGWTVNQYFANNGTPAISSLAAADNLVAGTNRNRINTLAGLDFIDFGPGGVFPNDQIPSPLQDGDFFAFVATATMVVNTAGTWQMGMNNDDGGRLRIDGAPVIVDDAAHGRQTKTGTVTLTKGTHTIEYLFFEGSGGMGGEVFWYLGSTPQLLRKTGYATPGAAPDLVISEFLSKNDTGLKDGDGDREDWIEIYNPTSAPVNLSGYFLTDDALVLNKWAFPAQDLPAGGYLLVWASGKALAPPGQLHASFKLASAGSYVGLTKADGAGGFTVVDHYDAKPMQGDVSYGRSDTESREGWMTQPTPLGDNLATFEGLVGDTKFSVDRGFFTAPFLLEITVAGGLGDTSGAQIRYTTDGSIPSWNAGTVYTGPIPISQTTVVRATALKKGFKRANVDTQTYVRPDDLMYQDRARTVAMGFPPGNVGSQIYRYGMNDDLARANETAMKNALKAIPMMCLTMDQNHFSTVAGGIYTNAGIRGLEQPGSIEMINQSGDGLGNFQINCGVRVRGNASRSAGNPKHSFRLFFNTQYDGPLDFDWWKPQGSIADKGATTVRHMDLRTSQNYGWQNSDSKNTFLREELSRDLLGATGQAYSRCRYVHLCVNGVYWGLYNTDERCSGDFGASYLGGDDDNYDVMKATPGVTEVTDGYMDKLPDGTDAPWRQLWNLGRQIRAATTGGDALYFQAIGKNPDGVTPHPTQKPLLDADNLIDYQLCLWQTGGMDGPASIFLQNASNNWSCLRERSGDFGGFRFSMHDDEHSSGVDVGSGTGMTSTFNNTTSGLTWTSGIKNEERSLNQLGPWGVGDGIAVTTAGAASGLEFNYKGIRTWETGGTFNRSNPQYLTEDLAAGSLEYRLRMADRAHKHLVQIGGALTDSRVLAMIQARAAVVRTCLLAEQARWGNETSLTVARWERARQMYENWIIAGNNTTIGTNLHNEPVPATVVAPTGPGRAATLLAQLRAYSEGVSSVQGTPPAGGWIPRPLYPNLNPPQFSQFGGVMSAGSNLTLSLPVPGASALFPATTVSTGVIVATTDGSDPRVTGGAVRPGATTLAPGGQLVMTQSGKVRARTYDATAADPQQAWSALAEAQFIVGFPASGTNLAISEINYNPAARTQAEIDAGVLDRDDFEFVELLNIHATRTVELTGLKFTAGILFDFNTSTIPRLAPGERVLVVKNRAAFNIRYAALNPAALPVAGEYTGSLDNSGELITLSGSTGAVVRSLTYDDAAPWPATPDGDGPTLVLKRPTANPNHALPANWRAHAFALGNPGGPDSESFASWSSARSTTPTATADDDGDGLSNLVEYALGLNPAVPNAGLDAFLTGAPAGSDRISFVRNASADDVLLTVQVSPDLGGWAPLPTAAMTETPNGDGTITVTVDLPQDAAATRRFVRLLVSTF